MGKTYHALWVHLVWATKYRQPLIVPKLKYLLYDQLRDIAQDKGYHLNFINGVEDHVHLLMEIAPRFSVSDIVKDLKGLSYKWVNDQKIIEEHFHWQDGFAAISVSPDRLDTVRGYIRKQERHHQKVTSEVEWELFAKQAVVYSD
jgi:putative transposase